MPLLPSHTLIQAYSLTLAITSYILLTSPSSILNASPLWLLGEAMHMRTAHFSSSLITPPLQSSRSKPASTTLPLPQATTELLALVSLILFIASITQSILCTPLRYSPSDLTRLALKSVGQSSPSSLPSTNNMSAHSAPGISDIEAEDSKSAFAEKLYHLHASQTVFLTLSAVRVLGEGALVAWFYLFHSTRGDSPSQTTTTTGVVGLLANRIVFTVAMGDMLFWGYIWTVLRDEAREVAGLVGKRRILEEEREQKM